MAFVLIPHLDPTHDSIMPEILSRRTQMPVREVSQDETPIQKDHVYVIKPNTILTVSDGTLRVGPRVELQARRKELSPALAERNREARSGLLFVS